MGDVWKIVGSFWKEIIQRFIWEVKRALVFFLFSLFVFFLFKRAFTGKNIIHDVRFECPQQVVTHRRVVSVGRYKFATVAVRPNLSIDQTIIIMILWATGPLLPSTVSALFTALVVASRDPLDDSPRLPFVGHSAVFFWD